MVHVIGDSHSESFNGYPGFVVHVIGRATAYNLEKDNSTTQSKQKTIAVMSRIPENEIVLFVLGEIDCRVHIYQKYMENHELTPIEKLIEITVVRYIGFLKRFNKHRVAVATIPPAGYEGNAFNYPFYGSPETRAYINKTFNETLVKHCRKSGIPCVDIYGKVVNEKGLVKQEYLRDQIHFNHRAITLMVDELRRLELWG